MRERRSLATMAGVVLLFVTADVRPAVAQETPSRRGEWYNLGLSAARPPLGQDDRPIPNFNLSYNFGRNAAFYRINLDYFGALSLNEPPFVYSLGVGRGRRSFSRYHLAALSAGPAIVTGRWAHDWEANNDGHVDKDSYWVFSPALIADVQMLAKPLGFVAPELGAGIELYGNLNFHRSFFGVRLVVHGNNTH